ncbi:MAG TPA: four helix bundle protein [Nitrospirae bacterium]|nr:four helix bundle protein [Nitrospirota bacterium]
MKREKNRQRCLTSQLRRAAVSIAANISARVVAGNKRGGGYAKTFAYFQSIIR